MRYRSRLVRLAQRSRHPRSLHAALVSKGNSILGTVVNHDEKHAEAVAVRDALSRREDLKGTTLFTTMIRRKSGTVGNGSPCPRCMRVIQAAGVERVVVYV